MFTSVIIMVGVKTMTQINNSGVAAVPERRALSGLAPPASRAPEDRF
jgi:hypothetical protein